jgi:hypothetical protein
VVSLTQVLSTMSAIHDSRELKTSTRATFPNDDVNTTPKVSDSRSHRSPRSLPSLDLVLINGRPRNDNSPSHLTPQSAKTRSVRPLPAPPSAPASAPARRSPVWSTPNVRPLPSPPRSVPASAVSTPVVLEAATPFTRRRTAPVTPPPKYLPLHQFEPIPTYPHPRIASSEEDDDDDLLSPSLSTKAAPPTVHLDISSTNSIDNTPKIPPPTPDFVFSPTEIPEFSFPSPNIPELTFSPSDSDEECSLHSSDETEPSVAVVSRASPPSSPPRPALPTLVTKNLEFLSVDPSTDSFSPLSPYSPGIPQPPTPRTAKRKRLCKLRRFLGESLPADAICFPPGPAPATPNDMRDKILRDIGADSTDNKYLRAAIMVGKILEISSDGEDEDGEESDSDGDGDSLCADDKRSTSQFTTGTREDYSWVLENGIAFKSAGKRRFSQKWLHEKGRKRWEEPDYQNVISALRSL